MSLFFCIVFFCVVVSFTLALCIDVSFPLVGMLLSLSLSVTSQNITTTAQPTYPSLAVIVFMFFVSFQFPKIVCLFLRSTWVRWHAAIKGTCAYYQLPADVGIMHITFRPGVEVDPGYLFKLQRKYCQACLTLNNNYPPTVAKPYSPPDD